MLEIKSYQAERLPKVNLVAQYSLFAKYNYQDYFTKFQRNNAQMGASIEIPLIVGRSGAALDSRRSKADIAKLRIEVGRTRARITSDLRDRVSGSAAAEMARDVARADLDLTREELTLDLAQMDEGRLPLATVEAAARHGKRKVAGVLRCAARRRTSAAECAAEDRDARRSHALGSCFS